MFLVTGATGHLGSAVVSQLLKKTKASEISVLARDENKASAIKAKGIDVRIGSYDDTSSLDKAIKGVSKLLLISGNGPNRLQQHKNVVIAAKKAGVAQIVYPSISIKDMKSAAIRPIMESISLTDNIIKESGLKYTLLRNTLYTGGTPLYGGEKILKSGIF